MKLGFNKTNRNYYNKIENTVQYIENTFKSHKLNCRKELSISIKKLPNTGLYLINNSFYSERELYTLKRYLKQVNMNYSITGYSSEYTITLNKYAKTYNMYGFIMTMSILLFLYILLLCRLNDNPLYLYTTIIPIISFFIGLYQWKLNKEAIFLNSLPTRRFCYYENTWVEKVYI